MRAEEIDMKSGHAEFAEYWDNFRPFPFKWASHLINQSRYLLLSIAFVYLLLAALTFFPSLGGSFVKVLITYPSLNLILLGWMVVVVLTVQWRHKIPFIFQWLWENERLGLKNAELKNEYKQFLQEYQETLLSKRDPLLFTFFLVILYASMAIATRATLFLYFLFTPMGSILIFLALAIVLLWIFFTVLAGWLLVITSIYIGKLTRRFSIQIQPSHPDGCGGLKPLGDFCFSLVMPLIVGGLFLAIIPNLRLDNMYQALIIVSTFVLFLIVGPLTILTIYLAFWNIHSKMLVHKRVYEDKIGGQILNLEDEIVFNTSGQGDLAKAITAKEKLEILKSLHPDKVSYPVWPFKVTSTVLLILSPQILQTLLGIATGLYEFIRNL